MFKRAVSVFILSYAFWIFLFFDLDPQILFLGFLVSLAVAAVSWQFLVLGFSGKILDPKRWVFLFLYILELFKQVVLANLRLAGVVLSKKPAISPGFVHVALDSKDERVIALVANSITMTPGTLSVDVDRNGLLIHWLFASTEDEGKARGQIVGKFEGLLRRVIE